MIEIICCLIMFSECLYLWSVTKELDRILFELRDFMNGDDNNDAD